MTVDQTFFKYRPINKYLIESLVNPSLYFAKPSELNDPFDCRLNLESVFKQAALTATGKRQSHLESALSQQTFLKNFQEAFDNSGVCSFSLVNNETLLWSHYADRHKGVCLSYQIPRIHFSDDDTINIDWFEKVNYGPETLIKLLQTCSMELNDFILNLIPPYLSTKSPSWGYEKEFRIIRKEHGIRNIHGYFLKKICFGLETPNSDIELVTKLANNYCGCTYFEQMVRDDSAFGFTMRPLTESLS